MSRLISTTIWDLRLETRYHILTVALLIATLYGIALSTLPIDSMEQTIRQKFMVLLIVSDPAIMGFIFIGVLVLFEKDSHTLQALVVSPLCSWEYLWAKVISLSLIAVPCSLVIAYMGHVASIHLGWLLPGLLLTSAFFILIGFVGVAQVKTFNQYILVIPLAITPLCLPILGYLNIVDGWFWYLIPTQGSFLLLEAGLGAAIPLWKLVYALVYLSLGVFVAHQWALRAFNKYIVQASD